MRLYSRSASLGLLWLVAAVSLYGADKPITVALPPDGLSHEERAPLQVYLTKQMGQQVNFVYPNSYIETLEGLGNGTYDYALLGALTYVRAHAKYGVVPLVQRDVDVEFHAVFITGMLSSIHSLKDLKGKQFAFGDVNSTSGHLIPYRELKKAGIDSETDLKFRYSGGHPLTAKLVETGTVDAGVLDESVYNSLIAGGKIDRTKVRIFYTSKPFVDYVYVARKSAPDAERDKFSRAFQSLKEGKDDQVLKILRAKRYLPANDGEYSTIRQIAKDLKML
jgi:phosphonate transport system substrate-binding protein